VRIKSSIKSQIVLVNVGSVPTPRARAGFELYKGKTFVDAHAVVINGYQYDENGDITELYVYDDRVGPYCHVSPKTGVGFLEWDYEWTEKADYSIKLSKLIVPVYHKIRSDFVHVFSILQSLNTRAHGSNVPAL